MELLIAVSLVSLLSLGILFAIRVGLNALEKTNQTVLASRRFLGAQRVMEQQIAGFMPVKALCAAAPDVPPSLVFFFQGEPQSMRFVSSYSMPEASRGYPRILEFQVIPGERNEGVRLVVNELLYTGPLAAGSLCFGMLPDPQLGTLVPRFRPIEVGPRSFVLADRLAACRFAYLEPAPPPLLKRWSPRWVTQQPPLAIRIELIPLASEKGRLLPVTLTLPLRVNRDPMFQYAD